MVALRTRPAPAARAVVCFLLLFALPTLISSPGIAQEVTGSLQGVVVSAETGPEPEVRVTLSGTNLQGTRETRTDRKGFFQFQALPPGSYTLQFTRGGLRATEVPNVVVELGRTTEIPKLIMAIQPVVMAPVVVKGTQSAVRIDPVHTAGGGNLSVKDYELLPVDRDYKSIITILPGANESYRGDPVNVGGSTGMENQYYIDGVNVTDPGTSERATSLPYNFVRAVDVKTDGYGAQYGRALGAIVNAVTYSGTNDFEMNVFGYVQPGAWAMDPAVAPLVEEHEPVTYDFGARLSGPLAKNRLWYSVAANPRVDQMDKEIQDWGLFTEKTETVRFAGKLKWQASSKTNMELSVLGDPTVFNEVHQPFPGITTVLNPDILLHKNELGGVISSLRATVAPSQTFLLEMSLALQQDRHNEGPTTQWAQEHPQAYIDFIDGAVGGGVGGTGIKQDRDRISATARGTILLPGHTMVAGVDYEDLRTFSSGNGDAVFRDSPTVWVRSQSDYTGTVHNRSPAVYLQDSWRLTDRFAFNPGLRWSAQFLVGESGHVAQQITHEWQPRLGFSWLLDSNNTHRLFGSYGRFYQTIPTYMAGNMISPGSVRQVTSFYSSDPREAGTVPDTVITYADSEERYAEEIPDLQTENFDEFTLGYERLVLTQTKLSLRAVRRDLRSSFQVGFDPAVGTVLGTPGKGDMDYLPPPRREYTALEIAAQGAWRRCDYRVSYLLSRTWGNYPGLFDTEPGYAQPGSSSTFSMPHQAENSTGYLPNDRTHVFKLSGAWTSQLGLEAGTFVTIESGTPINEFVVGPTGWSLSPSFLVSRGTAGRTPTLWNVDLRFGYQLPTKQGPRLKVLLDLLHVGNPRTAVAVDEYHYLTPDKKTLNPNYKQPIAYQPPMAARMGIEANF